LADYQASHAQQSALDDIRARIAKLTPREWQVLDLVIAGKQNKQIASELGITLRTVKAHRHQVMEKMQVETVAELVSLSIKAGRSP
jgi:RNA polymerase sigma factor (sigma-70 family)